MASAIAIIGSAFPANGRTIARTCGSCGGLGRISTTMMTTTAAAGRG